MKQARTIIRNLLLTALIILAGCASRPDSGPTAGRVYLEPTPVPIAAFKVTEREYRFEKEGVVIVVAFLDQRGLDGYYAAQELTNPFATIFPLLRPTVFLARIENHGLKPIVFNPALSGMVDDNGKPYVNRDLTDFYSYLGEDADREKRMAALRSTLFDTQVRLTPGASAERMLVYDAIGEGVKGVKLVLRDVYVGHLPIEVPFLFSCSYK